jgi:hypothetical protein
MRTKLALSCPNKLSRQKKISQYFWFMGLGGATICCTALQTILESRVTHGPLSTASIVTVSMRRKIQTVLETADFSFLPEAALKIRHTQDETVQALPKPLACSINENKFASGQYNVVVELELSDSTSWIARIRLPDETAADDAGESSILAEMTAIRLVGSSTSIPVPKIHDFDISLPNSLDYRYILMEALPGCILPSRFSQSVPQMHWAALASQLASFYYQLSCLRFPRIGSIIGTPGAESKMEIASHSGFGPFSTSLEYFYAHRKSHTRMIEAQHPNDDQWATASWMMTSKSRASLTGVMHKQFLWRVS